jgi:hypothetical protein
MSSMSTTTSARSAADEPGRWHVGYNAVMASIWLADEAARLVRDVLWCPQLTWATRRWRTWSLSTGKHTGFMGTTGCRRCRGIPTRSG